MSDDGVTDPSTTLLARVTSGPSGAAAVAALVPGSFVVGPQDVVVWVGDVVAGPDEAVAVAVIALVPGTPHAEVRAAAAPDEALVARLGREVAAFASGQGCTTVGADPTGPGEPGPVAVVARVGLVGVGPARWSVD